MPSRARQSGFTLVEVLVATVVLAIGLLAALTAFSMAARVTGASANDTTVSFLAQQKLSEIEAWNPQQLPAGTTAGDFAPTHPDYSWRLTIHPRDELHVIRVDLVIYTPSGTGSREFQFNTAVF